MQSKNKSERIYEEVISVDNIFNAEAIHVNCKKPSPGKAERLIQHTRAISESEGIICCGQPDQVFIDDGPSVVTVAHALDHLLVARLPARNSISGPLDKLGDTYAEIPQARFQILVITHGDPLDENRVREVVDEINRL